MYNLNMEAYIEYVILDNFSIDLLLLIITMKLLRRDISRIRLILSALIGTVSAVFMPLSPDWLAFVLRIITAPIMCLVIRHKNIKSYILFLLVMLTVTFAIGGMIIAIFNMSISDNYTYIIYPDKGIIGLSVLGIIAMWYVLTQLTRSVIHKVSEKRKYLVKIISNNITLDLNAYLDTGLKLYDCKSKPIIVASNNIANDIISAGISKSMVTTNTIDGLNETICYIMERILIYSGGQVNTINNVGCIISKTNINESDLLIHSDMVKEG